jgi:hypothetical protein
MWAKAKPKAVPRLKLTTAVSQAAARALVPPEAHIWRGLTRGEWCGHRPPYRRVSFPWHRFGEQGALKECLQALWRQHFAYTGGSVDTCPVEGLFDAAK